MNRQIKFRVWNGYEMVEDVTVGKHGAFWTSGISESDNQSLGNTTKYDNYLAVMQFTGLHDKNGKEIYVGDILKQTRLNGSIHYYKIFNVNGGFAFNTHQDDFYKPQSEIYFYESTADMQNSGFISNLEIIGNAFENPALIKL